MVTATDLYWDPFDVEIDIDPHPTWKRMRDDAPVYRNDRHDFFALTRYHDVEAAHRDPKSFCSVLRTALEPIVHACTPTGQMIFLDPPATHQRQVISSRATSPRHIEALEDRVRGSAPTPRRNRGKPGFDFLQDFGAKLPSMVISSLLGVPDEDQETFRHAIDRMFHIEPGVGMVNDISLTAGNEISTSAVTQLEA